MFIYFRDQNEIKYQSLYETTVRPYDYDIQISG